MPFLKRFKACPDWKRKEQITYKSGSRHTVYFLNGDRHVGDWLNNRKEGAEFTRNGYLYEGDFSDERRHGHGVLSKQQEDGSLRLVYSGGWQHGKRHGWGMGRGPDGAWYEGCWQAGRRTGEGRMWLPDGAFYHGEWLQDKFHGHGILVQPNGNCFEGEFYGGLKHGRGCHYHADVGLVQEGVWDEDVCVSSILRSASHSATKIPPNELVNPDAVAEESQQGALQRVRSKSAQNSGSNKPSILSDIPLE